MIWSDKDIREALYSGRLQIKPLAIGLQVQPAGIDLRLDGTFLRYSESAKPIDCLHDEPMEEIEVEEGHFLALPPGEFILGSTIEEVKMPNDVAGRIVGRNSISRLGVHIHCAGVVDPGFEGNITIGLVNFNFREVKLTPGMRIVRLVLVSMTSAAEYLYGDSRFNFKYQGQKGVTGSRIRLEMDEDE